MTAKQQQIISPNVAEYPPGHWSNCIRVGDMVYVSGMTSRGNDLRTIHGVGDPYEQARVVFTKIRHCLEAAGAKMSDIVTMTIYVTDIAHNKEIWRARREFFSGHFPCSALVQVAGLASSEILVEIQVQAHVGSGV
jgi:enamine deaminase RidA (YjgF/YER057c/UK114 family)